MMKIVDKEMFELAQLYANNAVKIGSLYCWETARKYLKRAYGL